MRGGSSSGLMTARGAADFLTRATAMLAAMFVLLASRSPASPTVSRAPTEIDESLARTAPAAAPAAAAPLARSPTIRSPAPRRRRARCAGHRARHYRARQPDRTRRAARALIRPPLRQCVKE